MVFFTDAHVMGEFCKLVSSFTSPSASTDDDDDDDTNIDADDTKDDVDDANDATGDVVENVALAKLAITFSFLFD